MDGWNNDGAIFSNVGHDYFLYNSWWGDDYITPVRQLKGKSV